MHLTVMLFLGMAQPCIYSKEYKKAFQLVLGRS